MTQQVAEDGVFTVLAISTRRVVQNESDRLAWTRAPGANSRRTALADRAFGMVLDCRESTLGGARRPAPRLRLIAAAHMRLAVAAAVRRSLALIQLRGLLLTELVGVVFDLAGMRCLFVTWVLFARHGGFLVKWTVEIAYAAGRRCSGKSRPHVQARFVR